jgi:NADH:ubiquinone oxidoreductase subunit F (NADH-binding)/NADH:ubiquinone oxidoreductase subunit E
MARSMKDASSTQVLGTPDSLRASRRAARSQTRGRQPDAQALQDVQALLGQRPPEGFRRDLLIEYLHRLNDEHAALSRPHLVALAHVMNLPMVEVLEVASFYHHFQILEDGEAAPHLTVRVCESVSCALQGSDALLQRLGQLLGPEVRVIPAPCVGRCDQAPVAVVGQRPVGHATPETVQALVMHGSRHDPGPTDALSYQDYRAAGGYALAASVVNGETPAEQVLQALEQSGLRGLGGAGFPMGRKWRIVREQPAPRHLVVNLDEGEPGTFKDRTYLEQDPHRFLEGVLIAAQVVGTAQVFIYLRDEYHGCRAMLQQAIDDLENDPPCPLPEIELRRGAGAYICGEESALIESLEGKRGEPRKRPPYIAQVGLFGRPTLAHNFETLYWVRDIVSRGAEWFAAQGRHGRHGLRSFSVSGRVQRPGVKLAPAGITLRELIDEHCGGMADGHALYAYLPGGASGGILPASLADVPLDFDTLQTHGCFIGSAAVVVLSNQDRARDAALNVMRFFADESCGQCTPCRVGTDKAAQLMQAAVWDQDTLLDLATVMADASICGLGQAAPNPIRCVLQYFPHEVDGSATPLPTAPAGGPPASAGARP